MLSLCRSKHEHLQTQTPKGKRKKKKWDDAKGKIFSLFMTHTTLVIAASRKKNPGVCDTSAYIEAFATERDTLKFVSHVMESRVKNLESM